MREQIPSPSTVAVVVEPRAEDEVRGDAKEEAALVSDANTIEGGKSVHDNKPGEESPMIR